MLTNRQGYMTPEEYLEFERKSEAKHEYVNGCVYAMSGASLRHAILIRNLYEALRERTKSCGCTVFTSALKQRVEATNSYYYPDILVLCNIPEDRDSDIVYEPVLLIEVLSQSTSVIDKREKVFAYRQIPSLKEYLIVHQRLRRLELHRRITGNQWNRLEFRPGDEVILESLPGGSLKLSFNAIYLDADASGSNIAKEEEAEYDLSLDW